MRYFKGLGYGLIAWFMCFLMGVFTSVLIQGHFMLKIIIGFCTASITLGLYFNWAFYAAKKDKAAVKSKRIDFDKFTAVKMAIFALIPDYIMLIWLYLMKFYIIADNFAFYLFFNIWIKPFADAIAEQPLPIESVSWFGIFGITILILLKPATVIITYVCTYYDVDVYRLLFFKE